MNKKIVVLLGIIFLIGSAALLTVEFNTVDNISRVQNDSQYQLILMDKDPTKNETIATSSVLADFASNIIHGTSGQVEFIMPGGACPAHYEVTPSDYNMVSTADIIFSHGMEGGFWLNNLLAAANNTAAEKKVGPPISGIPWGPPANAVKYVDQITKFLNQTYNQPENISKFNNNSANYKAQILGNKTYLEGLAVEYGFAGVKVICMSHQEKFLEWLGFEVIGSWAVSDEQMSVAAVNALIGEAIAGGAVLIISNLQSGTDVGAQIAASSNAIHVVLSNFPGAVPLTPTYLDTIRYNVQQLKHGKDLYTLYQNLLSGITAERDLFQILSYIFIGVAIIASIIAVFQQLKLRKLK